MPGRIQEVYSVAITKDMLAVEWPQPMENGSAITNYAIYQVLKASKEKIGETSNKFFEIPISTLKLTETTFHGFPFVRIQVSAINVIGEGYPSEAYQFILISRGP